MTNTTLFHRSEYVTMRDGVRLAVSLWLTEEDYQHHSKCPAVLITTRYWRASAFRQDNDNPALQWPSLLASVLLKHGCRLIVTDARGSGASFGFREAEIDHNEVEDIGELIDWVAQQAWCDGQVATTHQRPNVHTLRPTRAHTTACTSHRTMPCPFPHCGGANSIVHAKFAS